MQRKVILTLDVIHLFKVKMGHICFHILEGMSTFGAKIWALVDIIRCDLDDKTSILQLQSTPKMSKLFDILMYL